MIAKIYIVELEAEVREVLKSLDKTTNTKEAKEIIEKTLGAVGQKVYELHQLEDKLTKLWVNLDLEGKGN